MPRTAYKTGIVLGACGALGHFVTNTLLSQHWTVIGVDVASKRIFSNFYTHVQVDVMTSIETQRLALLNAVADTPALHAVINVAGGWAGGSAAEGLFSQTSELMIRQSLFSSLAAAHVVAERGAKNGLLLLPGAAAALHPTSGMLGYGVAKAGVHYLARSLAADSSQLPEGLCVLAVLPTTLDTPANRGANPGADRSSWTPLEVAADLIAEWANGVNRPPSGSLVALRTESGKTVIDQH